MEEETRETRGPAKLARDGFEEAARAGWLWFAKARSHRRVALILDQTRQRDDERDARVAREHADEDEWIDEGARSHVSDQMMLAMGFALENLLKGVLAADRTMPIVDEKGRLTQRIKHHDLVVLARDVGFALDRKTESFLTTLTVFVRGLDGRYHIPSSAGGRWRPEWMPVSSTPLALFEPLFEQLATDLHLRHADDPLGDGDAGAWVREWMRRDIVALADESRSRS